MAAEQIPVVGLREPCPCGSGRRYKACHGRAVAAVAPAIARPFLGLPDECDWVAMREIVPAATAELRLLDGREVMLASVLPMAWPALHRDDGRLLLGLQVQGGSGDASRDLAAALERAIAAPAGTAIESLSRATPGPRLQDLLDLTHPLSVQVHEGLDFWVSTGTEMTEDVKASLDQANSSIVPSGKVGSVAAAYWCRIGDKEFLRWVQPHDEDRLTDALARLRVKDADRLGPGTKFVGAFRADGLLVPVWSLVPGSTAEDMAEPAVDFGKRLDQALADDRPLSSDERRIRGGIISRQVTLR